MEIMSKKLILLDGNSLFNRAFFALPLLMNKKGFYTNAIYGFTNMANNIIESHQPDYMVVAFDLKAPTFRHKEFDDYKAGRMKMPEELAMQVEPLKKVVEALGIQRAEFAGYEADDIIGTLSKFGEEEGLEVIIVTGDKDALQLASEKTKVLITKKGISETEEYDAQKVIDTYGLTPTEFIDLKALMGDKSDNIKGVAGIGEKTGIKLLKEYHSIENIYENIEQIKGAVKTRLENDKESAFLSKRLATIVRDMPLELDLEDLKFMGIQEEELAELYREFEFTSLLNKLAKEATANQEDGVEEKAGARLEPVINPSLPEELADLKEKKIFLSADLEKDPIKPQALVNKVYMELDGDYYMVPEDQLSTLKELLEEETNKVIGHDLKSLYKALLAYNIDMKNIYFDIEVAQYVIDANSGKYSLEDINNQYGLEAYEGLEAILGKGRSKISPSMADPKRLADYYCNTLYTIKEVYPLMERTIEEDQLEEVFYQIEMPLIQVLADMEIKGFAIDMGLLKDLSDDFGGQIRDLEKNIHELAGEAFNINSPKQLGVILFEKLGLPVGKKTKTGYSTNVEVLESLRDKHPIIDEIMEYRQLAKLKSTYIDGLDNIIDQETQKVHTTFSQTTASTGRLSSLEPNLQNIPVRTERGRRLRGLFIAEEGYQLIDADYSQIELRILAHLANDPDMIQAFADHVDIHTKTAAEVFGLPIEMVTPEMRSAAKAVNFGIIYGMSDFGLSSSLGISMAQAKEYIKQYLDKYQEVKKYLEDIVKEIEKTGYSKTICGRRRYIPELRARNAMVRSFGKRLALNTPIQGSAADIIKLAMIQVDQYLKENYEDARLLLQVHDELIVQAREEDAQKIEEEMIRIMEEAVKLRVDLKVEASIGKSWLETK